VVDSLTIITVSNNIRYEYIQATIKIIKNLKIISSGERFDATVKGLIIISYDIPVKIICVNLFSYD